MHLRLSGKVKNKDLLEAEIIRGKMKPEYYEHLSRSMGYLDIKSLTETAIKYNNSKAVMSLLKANVYAATSALSTKQGSQFLSQQMQNTQGTALVQIFFMVRTAAPIKYKKLMRRLARNVILRTSLKIAGRGLRRGMVLERTPYVPGMLEFDLERTLPNILQKGNYISYQDFVGIRRTKAKKNVVLILDTSGSMYGKSLLNAALTTSVLSYVMNKDNYSVILFNSNAMILKRIKEELPITKIIDNILDSEAVGFTNISRGLKTGLKQLDSIHGKHKIAVLITDGNYNRGSNPIITAMKFKKLHVIAMPPDKNKYEGLQICRDIAKAGKGHYYPVEKYHEIPRALLKILKRFN
jgi:Mg-chelatase subunit ChlD